MLLRISEFRDRVGNDMDRLVSDLQQLTHRNNSAEEQSWRISLPKVSMAFSAPAFEGLDLFFGGNGHLALEYLLPGGTGWADMVLLGNHAKKPAAVIVELKDWLTRGDLPGIAEGLMHRHGRSDGHPSDQVRGYAEWCRNFHSAVLDRAAAVHGCVLFTKDPFYHSYRLAPNDDLTRQYPCFSTSPEDITTLLPDYIKGRLSEPNRDFAQEFEAGAYKQSRGFVQLIGAQILSRDKSPFVLLDSQRTAFALVKARVSQAIVGRRTKKTVILIEGPPGSGKSVVAAKVWASLATNPNLPSGNVVVATTSSSQKSNWRYLFERAAGTAGAAGVVVPATNFTPLTNPRFGQLSVRYRQSLLNPFRNTAIRSHRRHSSRPRPFDSLRNPWPTLGRR